MSMHTQKMRLATAEAQNQQLRMSAQILAAQNQDFAARTNGMIVCLMAACKQYGCGEENAEHFFVSKETREQCEELIKTHGVETKIVEACQFASDDAHDRAVCEECKLARTVGVGGLIIRIVPKPPQPEPQEQRRVIATDENKPKIVLAAS